MKYCSYKVKDVKYAASHNTSQLDEVEKQETETMTSSSSSSTTVIQDDGKRELTETEKKYNEVNTFESEGMQKS